MALGRVSPEFVEPGALAGGGGGGAWTDGPPGERTRSWSRHPVWR